MEPSFNQLGSGGIQSLLNFQQRLGSIKMVAAGILIGIGFGAIGALLFFVAQGQLHWTKTSATVISYSTSTDRHGEVSYTPRYEYQVAGVRHESRSDSSSSNLPIVGQQIEIYYDPQHPEQSTSSTPAMMMYIGLGLAGVGVAAIIFTLFGFARSRGGSLAPVSPTMSIDIPSPVATPVPPTNPVQQSSTSELPPLPPIPPVMPK